MHLGILTGGGDVSGLNPAIKTVVNLAARRRAKMCNSRIPAWSTLLIFIDAAPARQNGQGGRQ